MDMNVIFRHILFILKYPVNPVIYMDVVVENCSYIFDTSAIHGGRIQVLHGAKTCPCLSIIIYKYCVMIIL